MNVYERARHYMIRKRGKSFLLGSIFVISLLVGLLGMTLLRSFNTSLVQIGRQSQAKITVFITQVEHYLSNDHINQLQTLENINFINRFNEVESRPEHLEISIGSNEDMSDAKVRLQGYDDLTLDSLFSLEIVELEEGTLAIEPGELIIYQPLALLNGLTIGDELSFQTEEGALVSGIIKGMYSYLNPDMENEEHAPSMYRFENLIFAHPDFVNQVQGEKRYLEAHLYVIDPNVIEETHGEIKTIISETTFGTWVSDALFRRMTQPLQQTANIIRMILIITGIATIVVTSSVLILWSKERKQEVALLLSIGESKASIVLQRMLEVLAIYIGAVILMLFLSYFITPYIGTLLYQGQMDLVARESLAVSLSIGDIITVFFLGIFTLIIAVGSSCLSMMRYGPRTIFSVMD